jgi:hypothetical protein
MLIKKLTILLIALALPFALISCSDDATGVDDIDDDPIGTTFKVNMADVDGFDPDAHEVYITGAHIDWAEPGDQPNQQLMVPEEDESMIYVIFYEGLENGEYEFKFFSTAIGEGWDGGEWPGDPNREVSVQGDTEYEGIFGEQPE